jgi:TolA-binding protein
VNDLSETRLKGIALALIILFLILFSPTPSFSQTTEETKLYNEGSSYCFQAKWENAVTSFKKLLAKYPATTYTDTRFWIGYSYVEMGKFNEGIDTLNEFAGLYPASGYAAQALYKIGEVYEKLRDYDKALQTYDRVIKKYPQDNAAMPAAQNKAEIYAQRKFDYGKAIENLEKSKTLAEQQGISTGSAYVTKANSRIQFIRKNSDFNFEPLKMFSLGLGKEEDRKWNEALGIYDALLQKYPSSKICDDTQFHKIRCLLAMGKRDRADFEAEKFLKQYPSSPYTEQIRSTLQEIKKKSWEYHRHIPIYIV